MIYLRRLMWLVIMPIAYILELITIFALFCLTPIGIAIYFIITGEFSEYIDAIIKIYVVIDEWRDKLGKILLNQHK